VLPTQSICLQVPIVMPRQYNDECAQKQREDAERLNALPAAQSPQGSG
jgi:hypothetical protein